MTRTTIRSGCSSPSFDQIPFKGTSKEYIGDDNTEIAEAVDRALRQCASQLRKITRARRRRTPREKKVLAVRPDCARAIYAMLQAAAEAKEPPSKRAKVAGDDKASVGSNGGKLWRVDAAWEAEVLRNVRDGEVTEGTIKRRLEEHVEKIDSEQALEYSMQNKEGLSETMHLVPTGVAHEHAPRSSTPTCAFRPSTPRIRRVRPQASVRRARSEAREPSLGEMFSVEVKYLHDGHTLSS